MLLAVVRPMHISVPISAGTLRWVLRQEQHPHHAAQSERHRHEHDQRIDPALEIDDQKQIDQHHRERHAARTGPGIALAHGFDLSAERHGDGSRSRGSVSRRAPCRSSVGRRSEIAALQRRR